MKTTFKHSRCLPPSGKVDGSTPLVFSMSQRNVFSLLMRPGQKLTSMEVMSECTEEAILAKALACRVKAEARIVSVAEKASTNTFNRSELI